MNWKLIVPIAIALFLGGYWAGKGQTQVIEKERIVKGETVTVTVEKIVTVIRVVKPDGTTTETTSTTERQIDKTKETEIVDKSKETTPVANDYGVGGGVKASLKSVDINAFKPDYYVAVSRRIIGDAWIDLSVSTDSQVGLGVKLEF